MTGHLTDLRARARPSTSPVRTRHERNARLSLVVSAPPEQLLGSARAVLAASPGVRLALLFGSTARGEADESSDLDVAVLGEHLDLLGIAAALRDATGREVDVVSLQEVTIPLLAELVKDALVLFEGEKGAAARWRSSALLALETDLPWYRRMRDAFIARLASSAPPSEAGNE